MRGKTIALVIPALLLAGCGGGGFSDGDYVGLTVELTLLGTRQGAGGTVPSDPALRSQWRREQVDQLLEAYGVTEEEYLEYSLELHRDAERYTRVLNDIALELKKRDQSLHDEEAPEEVKPPPGSFG